MKFEFEIGFFHLDAPCAARFAKVLAWLVVITITVSLKAFSQSDRLLPAASISTGCANYQVGTSITAGTGGDTVSGNAAFTIQAGSYIDLQPGFHPVGNATGATFHAIASATSPLAPPSISPSAGTYRSGQLITLSAASSTDICCTTDGTNSDKPNNGTTYSLPLSLSRNKL